MPETLAHDLRATSGHECLPLAYLSEENGVGRRIAAAIIGACALWALDNNLTRPISGGNPATMAMAKGLEERGQVGATHMGTAFDAWYPGYIDYAPNFKNIAAFWTETAGAGLATRRDRSEPRTRLPGSGFRSGASSGCSRCGS